MRLLIISTIGRRSVSKLLTTLAATAFAIGAAFGAPALAQEATPTPHAETKAAFTAGLEAKFKSLDTNGDGSIESSEADAANAKTAQRTEAALSAKMDAEFARLDTNKDKQLSPAEFKAMAPKAKPVPAAESIGRVDGNKDKKLSFAEFSAGPLRAFDQVDANKDGTLSVAEQQGQAEGR
jgi:Ca2+-binding EF-hand superfamily protein